MSEIIKNTIYKALTQALSFILILLIFFIVISLMTGCNPVRDGYFNDKKLIKVNKHHANNEANEQEEAIDSSKIKNSMFGKLNTKQDKKETAAIWDKFIAKPRFSDTMWVNLPPVRASYIEGFDTKKKFDINDQFKSAIMDFDNGIFDRACSKFNFFSETLNSRDSLFNEALFYKAECMIQSYKLNDAENLLLGIYNSDNVPFYTMEKVIVRLGQIYCVKGDDKSSRKYFKELKDNFPNSQYLKLSDCSKFTKK